MSTSPFVADSLTPRRCEASGLPFPFPRARLGFTYTDKTAPLVAHIGEAGRHRVERGTVQMMGRLTEWIPLSISGPMSELIRASESPAEAAKRLLRRVAKVQMIKDDLSRLLNRF